MKRTQRPLGITVLALLAVLGFTICCGSSANDCDKAEDVFTSGKSEFCKANADVCMYCECYNQDLIMANDGTCEDPPKDTGDEVTCEGDALAGARACLENKEDCKAAGASLPKSACQAEHLRDECTEDADCILDMTCNTDTNYCMIN